MLIWGSVEVEKMNKSSDQVDIYEHLCLLFYLVEFLPFLTNELEPRYMDNFSQSFKKA